MHPSRTEKIGRRLFLKRAATTAGLGVAAPLALDLAAVGDAAAAGATDYKALVCVFLYGGNDHGNTLIPVDNTNYDLYSAIRGGGAGRTAGGLALAQSDLLATALTQPSPQTLTNNLRYALSPPLTGLASLWNQGKLAIQLNVGSLIAPLTKAQYQAGNTAAHPIPPLLMAHSDQRNTWMMGDLAKSIQTGFGGRLADYALAGNGGSTFTGIDVGYNSYFLAGDTARQYRVGVNGAVAINALTRPPFGGAGLTTALKALAGQSPSHAMEADYLGVLNRSIGAQQQLTSALGGVTLATPFHTNATLTAHGLADQLNVVAKVIASRATLGIKRQVFFVSLDGFDNHDGLLTKHPGLLAQLDEALSAFYAATVELGVQNQVTTFTMSDFGRSLQGNSDGSDHGWGSHHFILGGAVNGQKYYGTAPNVSLTSDDQIGQGRLLPSTASDQYLATLASWFGVADSDLASVVPRIGNYGVSNLGFV